LRYGTEEEETWIPDFAGMTEWRLGLF